MAPRISNILVSTLNVIFLLAGVALLGGGIYFHVHATTVCQKLIENSLFIVGSLVFVVSLLGLSGSCCRNNFLLWLYLILMFFMTVGLIVFAIFVFLVTNQSAGKVVSGRGVGEYRLGDYSNWLRNHFTMGKNWALFKTCLVDAQFCNSLASSNDQNFSDFVKHKVSPIQGICCMPPMECGLEYRNATYWIMPKTGPAVNNSDCKAWSNKQNELCFNCDICKAGFLATIRMQWRNLAIGFCVLIVFTFIVFAIGCRARKNNSFDNKLGKYQRTDP